jgi:hypothetical protein
VQAAAGQLIEAGKADEAHAVIEKFHAQLAQTKVLDPACGTGNFLYVALARMKELEGEVIGRLAELAPEGEKQTVAELSGHTITPENFLGIEINPRAAAIAQLVLWIGYLQWHFRVNGEGKVPPEPVLRDVKTIKNGDALIDCEKKVLERDEQGNSLTRWDGETKKKHPVTGKEVPDQEARVEVYRYVKPRPEKWPKADFIVGNPPFIGKGKRAVEYLGRPYLTALKSASKVKLSADYVMHWWDRAANLARSKLDFVRLCREAERLCHTYDAVCWNIMRFAAQRGTLVNIAEPDFEADGTDGVSERQAGFSIPGGGVRDAAGGEQIAGP